MRPGLQKIVHKFLRGTGPHPNPKTAAMIIILRGGGCLVSLPHLSAFASSCMQAPREGPRTQPRNRPTQGQNQETPKAESERRRQKKKKKTGAGRGRGVGVEHGVRVEVGELVREEENTRGTPNPPKGVWVSPAPERKEKKMRKHGVDETNQTQEKKRDTYKKPNTGRGLKGLKSITNTNPRDKNARQTTKEQRPRPEQKNNQRNHTRL